jgi:hypothetical protein
MELGDRARLANIKSLSARSRSGLVNQKQPANAIRHGERVSGCTSNVTRADDRNCGHDERRRSLFRVLASQFVFKFADGRVNVQTRTEHEHELSTEK